MSEVRVQFMKLIYQRVMRIIGMVALDDAWEFDTWIARTNFEAYVYVKTLSKLRTSRWRGIRDVRQEVLCFQQPLLPAKFHYRRKRDISS